jgi:hypothetical protein
MGSGAISLSAGSATITQAESSGLSGFSLETGPVADQTFAGTGYAPITPSLYLGQGQYNTIFDKTKPYVDPLANANGAYPLESVGFGKMTFAAGVPATQYFESLGYTNVTQTAVIAPNFQGIGLPTYYWYQVVNLLYNIDTTVQEDLNCVNRVGGQCSLANACASYAPLWQFSFKVQFTG